jgi:ParB/RepB/Spo0J family partition protein
MAQDVSVEKIRVHKNARKTFDDEAMAELQASIAQEGLLQPILVRESDAGDYLLIAGERRLRAVRALGWSTVPVMVQTADDARAARIQMMENLQRADLHPMEQAEHYAHILGLEGKAAPAAGALSTPTVGELAAQLGKSESEIYRILQFNHLPKRARTAFVKGTISAKDALQVARIPDAKLRQAVTQKLLSRRYGDNEKRMALRNTLLDLSGAPFPMSDDVLVPAAGSCTTCPKRAGNNPNLFGDVDGANVCTDPPCFQKKTAAHWHQVKAQAKKTGQTVIESRKEVRKIFPHGGRYLPFKSKYIKLSDRCESDPKRRHWRRLLGKDVAGKAMLVRTDAGTIEEVLPAAEAKRMAQERGHQFSLGARPGQSSTERERRQAEKLEMKIRQAVVSRAIAELRGAVAAAPHDFDAVGLPFWFFLGKLLVDDIDHGTASNVVRERGLQGPASCSPMGLVAAELDRMSIATVDGAGTVVALIIEVLALRFPIQADCDGKTIETRYGWALRVTCDRFGVDLVGLDAQISKDLRSAAVPKAPTRDRAVKKAAKKTKKKSTRTAKRRIS